MRRWRDITKTARRLISGQFDKAELHQLLADASLQNTLSDRVDWLEKLIDWLRSETIVSADSVNRENSLKTKSVSELSAIRVKYLLQVLERNQIFKDSVSNLIRRILLDTSAINLYAGIGIASQLSLLSEFTERLISLLLPVPKVDNELAEAFSRVFVSEKDAEWVLSIPTPQLEGLIEILLGAKGTQIREQIIAKLKDDLKQGIFLISKQISHLGINNEVRQRMDVTNIQNSIFSKIEVLALSNNSDLNPTTQRELLQYISEGRRTISKIFASMEQTGVSVALVYQLELLLACLDRLERLFAITTQPASDDNYFLLRTFIADLIIDHHRNKGLWQLLQNNFHLLSRKIVERNSVAGEHYIAQNRTEYKILFKSAAGGGLITVITAVVKIGIGTLNLPAMVQGLAHSLNYAFSFVTIHLLHFSLATKQSPMTATALASRLQNITDNNIDQKNLDDTFLSETAAITRSQFAAAAGNVGFVVPGALAFSYFWEKLFQQPLINIEYALYSLNSLNPVTSLTVPLAILTGGLLWTSTQFAGWAENLYVYRKLGLGIRQNKRLRAAFGDDRSKSISKWLESNIGGLAGNTTLGFLLAGTGTLGRFTGLPLDVRHITLSSGLVAICAYTLGRQFWVSQEFWWAIVGLGAIYICNFGISFLLSLVLAARARSITAGTTIRIIGMVGRHFLKNPWSYILPPKN